MSDRPDDLDNLFAGGDLPAWVRLLRYLVADTAGGDKAAADILAEMLPAVERVLVEVEEDLSGRN